MWQPSTHKLAEEEEVMGCERETNLDKFDFSVRHQHQSVYPVTLQKQKHSGIMPSRELFNEAIQAFHLDPKVKWQQGFPQNIDVLAVPAKEKAVMHPTLLSRQESEVIIDRRRYGKKIVPPDASPSEAPGPGCVQQLGVTLTRKVAQKRMREVDEETDETDNAFQKKIVDLNIGFKRSFKPDQPCSPSAHLNQATTRAAACQLIYDINKACLGQSTQSLAPKKVLIDQSLDWSDLDVPLKEFVGSGTFGIVSSFETGKGQKVIQKDLKPNPKKPQSLVHVNEVQVPLNFLDCSSITRVLAVAWDGQKASIFQEHAGVSFREAMQNADHRQKLQERSTTKKIMLGLFKAFEKLHIHGIKHRDAKPENTCWDPDTGQVRLIDFASCRTPQDEEEGSLAGITPEYLPPDVSECIIKRKAPALSEKSDVWGAAMIGLFIIKAGHPVIWYFAKMPEYLPSANRGEVLMKFAQLKVTLPEFFLKHPARPDMEVLLRGCLAFDEKKRWTSQQAVQFLQAKLNSEGSPGRKYRKLNGSPSLENVLHKQAQQVNPSHQIDDLDLKQSVAIRMGKTDGSVSAGLARVLKAPAPATPQFPPRSQLVTAMTPRAQLLAPHKLSRTIRTIQPVQPWSPEPEAADEEHLAWLKEACGVRKTTAPPQRLLDLTAQLGTQGSGRVGRFGTATPGHGTAQGYAFAGLRKDVAGWNFPFGTASNSSTVSRNAVALSFSNLPDTVEPCTTPPTFAPAYQKPVVIGMWGKVSPQQTPELPEEDPVQPQRSVSVVAITRETPGGNIPNFLNSMENQME